MRTAPMLPLLAVVNLTPSVSATLEVSKFAGVVALVHMEHGQPDVPAAAMHQAMVLREMRGSTHLLAIVAVGLSTPVAHAIKRPGDVQTFGWAEGEIAEPTDEDQAKWDRAEALTDELLRPAYAALNDVQATALIAGTIAMAGALGV